MKTKLQPIIVPPPEEIERRIVACKAELKALARIKRLSRAAKSQLFLDFRHAPLDVHITTVIRPWTH